MDLRVFDFQLLQPREEEPIDTQGFVIQMFGINETGETFSVKVEDFKPYFFCLVPDDFTSYHKRLFLDHLRQTVGKYYAESIIDCLLIKRKKLDGFDGQSDHNFICLNITNFIF